MAFPLLRFNGLSDELTAGEAPTWACAVETLWDMMEQTVALFSLLSSQVQERALYD